jgi:hypothetical protein
MQEVFPTYEINTPHRVAAFLAQCGHESGGWTVFEENLNYSNWSVDGSSRPFQFKPASSNIGYKNVDVSELNEKNEYAFELPTTKNVITFKLLTIADDKKIDEEVKGLKKNLGDAAPGLLTTKLKHQITSVNGDYSTKTIREFIDSGALLSIDSMPLRRYMDSMTPDIDSQITFTTKGGEEVTSDMPMTAEFFFPGSGI